MVKVLALSRVIESAITNGQKNLTGEVQDSSKLFDHESLKALERSHNGIFCFLGYVPDIHEEVHKTLVSGELTLHADDQTLVLFVSDIAPAVPRKLNEDVSSWLQISGSENEMLRFVREALPGSALNLPGLLLLERLTGKSSVIYVPFHNQKKSPTEIADLTFTACHLFNTTAINATSDFASYLQIELTKHGVNYAGGDSISLTEGLYRLQQFIRQYGGAIVSLIKFLKTTHLGT